MFDARALIQVEPMPPGAAATYDRPLPVSHDWKESGKTRRLVRFECSVCGKAEWVRHASRLPAVDGPSASCGEAIAAEIHES